MDRMMAGAPAPAVPRRRPFDPATVPPEVMGALAAGQPVPGPAGETYYPDGTMDDPPMAGGGPMGMGMGGPPAGGGLMAGAPPPAVGGAMDGDGLMITEDPAEVTNPLAGPMFRNYRQTANAGFPGAAGGIGGPPAGDPLLAGIPAPAVVEEPRFVQANPDYTLGTAQRTAQRGASMTRVAPSTGGDAEPGRTIRYGRKVYTHNQTPSREQPRDGVFQRKPKDRFGR